MVPVSRGRRSRRRWLPSAVGSEGAVGRSPSSTFVEEGHGEWPTRRFSSFHAITGPTRWGTVQRDNRIMRLKRALVLIAAVGWIATACVADKVPSRHIPTVTARRLRRRRRRRRPVTGGTLVFGSYSRSPASIRSSAWVRARRVASDGSVVRLHRPLNHDCKYEMRTAESVTPSADSLEVDGQAQGRNASSRTVPTTTPRLSASA